MSENHTLYKVEENNRKKYVNKSWHKKKKNKKKKTPFRIINKITHS